MNLIQIRELAHRLIVHDLAIRTLERDLQFTDVMKINRPLNQWIEISINKLREDYRSNKKALLKEGGQIQDTILKEEGSWTYTMVYRGTTHNYRYMTIALHNWVDAEIQKLLNIPAYPTMEGSK
ncbi:hypothetical protein LG296_20630 (plasmid) [Ureibacillus chungkukjangi]|uniref:hypothetical protein n=1 Tax=Ureibacillus chungkukjangi TaxID=1202712 RepID=UPI000D357E38|nr:hypothetical protein [Ureibacillus chungkukjangi]